MFKVWSNVHTYTPPDGVWNHRGHLDTDHRAVTSTDFLGMALLSHIQNLASPKHQTTPWFYVTLYFMW